MILIRFPDADAKRSALARLAGRFSFKSYANGEMLVPENALPFLAVEGVGFTVQGPATYEQIAHLGLRIPIPDGTLRSGSSSIW